MRKNFAVIPGRPLGPGPESKNTGQTIDFISPCSWIPGSRAKPAPRNDDPSAFFPQPVRYVGDHAMRAHAPPQILLGASQQVIHAALFTAVGERHELAIGGVGLHVVDRCNGVGSVAEGGVGRDVIDPFACRYFKFTVNVSNDRIYEQLTLSRFVRNFLNIGNLGATPSKYNGRREIKQTLAACNGSAADLGPPLKRLASAPPRPAGSENRHNGMVF